MDKILPNNELEKEAPKWDWYRVWNVFPRFEKNPEIPRVGGVPESDDKPDWRGVVRNNIQPLDKVEPYTFGKRNVPSYFWFDTPDYADPFKKMWYSMKFFSTMGGLCASGIAIAFGYPGNYKHIRLVLSSYFLPIFTGGLVYSATVILAANLRGNKDDMYNYLTAGLVTGVVAGRNCYIKHVRHTLFWVPAGCYAKYNAEINGHLAIQPKYGTRSINLAGNNSEGGIETGNLQFFTFTQGDPGRGVRRFA